MAKHFVMLNINHFPGYNAGDVKTFASLCDMKVAK